MNWLEDQVLAFLQRRCTHPGQLVAVDILEGTYDVAVSYCNRFGAAKINAGEWRRPDPNLWRGK
jgi:hypothetical protein